MKYLLDTDVCIALLNRKSPKLTARVLSHPAHDFGMSIVTAAELICGATKSARPDDNLRRVAMLRADVAT